VIQWTQSATTVIGVVAGLNPIRIHYGSGAWYLSCPPIITMCTLSKVENIEQAKIAAIELIRKKVLEVLSVLDLEDE